MSLILCLEDSAGQDTELEVNEGDDFASFLQKAKDILGYDVDLASITGDKDVQLTDNIYQFLIANDVECEEIEEETAPIVKEDAVTPRKPHSLPKAVEETVDQAGTEVDSLEEELKELENDMKSTNFETEDNTVGKDSISEKPTDGKISPEDLDEVEDVEYLMDDTEEEELLNTVEDKQPTEDLEEFAEIEYLDDDENEGQLEEEEMEVEMLDSELEEDIMQDLGIGDAGEASEEPPQQKRKDKKVSFSEMVGLNNEIEADKALLGSLNDEESLPPKPEGKQYTRKQLLDILEDSAHENSDDDTDLTTRQKIANRGKRKVDSYDKKMMKDLFYSTPAQGEKKKRRVSFEIDTKKAPQTTKMSRAQMEYLKTTVRQPLIEVINMSLSDINLCLGSIEEIHKFIERDSEFIISTKSKATPTGDAKYLPSKYEDVDNDGIYDYLDRDDAAFDPNDDGLLTVINEKPPSKKVQKQNKEDVISAIGGIQHLLGSTTPTPRKRGRPKKYDTVPTVPKPKKVRQESVEFDTFEDIKKEPCIDSDDDDYVPGKHVDWTKNKPKGKSVGFVCRMCGAYMAKLGQVNSHALSHRLPGRAVFPCILCPYGYTTYSELCKHIREEHDPKKMVMPKKVIGNLPKPMVGVIQTPKKGRGRPRKLTDERQRQQDDSLVGRIISNYTQAMPKYNKPNYTTKKQQVNNNESLIGKIIQPHFKIQPNFGNNDDSEDVEDVDMLEEWLDDEEELYIMEMTQNAVANIQPKTEAEYSSDRSRAALAGKRGEDNVFKTDGGLLDASADIVRRIKSELLADRGECEIKKLNVSTTIGEDHVKSIENDRIAFMSSIKKIPEKVHKDPKKNNGEIKIESFNSFPTFVSSTVKEPVQKVENQIKEVKSGKSIMDIACAGILDLVDPSFSAENVVDMPSLDVDISDTKIDPNANVNYNLEDALMESKQYDPSILSIEEDPHEFGLDDNVGNMNAVGDGIKAFADLDTDIEVGEIRDEEIAQQNDVLDKLVNMAADSQRLPEIITHSVVTDMPKLDDLENVPDAELADYQDGMEKLPEADIDSDSVQGKEVNVENTESSVDICNKTKSNIDNENTLMDGDTELTVDGESSPIQSNFDETEGVAQTAEEILQMDQEPRCENESDHPASDQDKTVEDDINEKDKISFVDESEKSVEVDEVSNVDIDIPDQTMPEDVSAMDGTMLCIDENDDKIEYNDFAQGSKELDGMGEISDEKSSDNICLDDSLSKLGSMPSLHVDSDRIDGESSKSEESVNVQRDDVKETDESSHEIEDAMSKLHGDTLSIGDEEDKVDNLISRASTESSEEAFPVSDDIVSSKLCSSDISHDADDIVSSKLDDLSSDRDDVVMMKCERKDDREEHDDKTHQNSASKPAQVEISSDDDIVTMDYDDFSNEPILESGEKSKSDNIGDKKNSKDNKSRFREFSNSSKVSRDIEDSDISIGLEFDYGKHQSSKSVEESPSKPIDSHVSDEDKLDYEEFSSEPNVPSGASGDDRKTISDESLVTAKLDDGLVSIDDSDDVMDFNISRSELNIGDQNV